MGTAFRIGQGFDFHRFSDDPSRLLVLGGVSIEGARGLAGHSDADVVAHALADSLLGAGGLGDIGDHFPETDPALEGADSIDLLRRSVILAADSGVVAVNADCTVIADQPRLAPFKEQMVANLSAALGAPVSVKATTTEGLGLMGNGEGIACMAVMLARTLTGTLLPEP